MDLALVLKARPIAPTQDRLPATHHQRLPKDFRDAGLALHDGGNELFVAWHNQAGELCWDIEEVTTDGSSGGGPGGPCVDRVEAAHPELIGGAGIYPAGPGHGPFIHIDTRGYRARWVGSGGG